MKCNKCKNEVNENSKYCNYCGKQLDKSNSYTPVSGGNKIRIILHFMFLVLLLPIFFVSSIPLLQSFLAIFIMKNDRNFNSIINLKKNLKRTLIVLGLGATIVTLISYHLYGNQINGSKYDPRVIEYYFLILIFGPLLTFVLEKIFSSIFDKLLFKPLFEHEEWILKHGIFYSPIKDIK